MHTSIPSKHREHHFQSVAHIWAEALRNFPNLTKVATTTLSPETLCRKLREGREAKIKYGWQNSLIDEASWKAHAEQISIEPFTDHVLMGGKDLKKANAGKAVVAAISTPELHRPIMHVNDTIDGIERICKLMNDKVLSPRPIIYIYNLTSNQVASLEERYDLAINPTATEGIYEIL